MMDLNDEDDEAPPMASVEEREALFKKEIEPLMLQLVDLCEQHQFPLVAVSEIATEQERGELVMGALWVPGWAIKRIHLLAALSSGKVSVHAMKNPLVPPMKIVD